MGLSLPGQTAYFLWSIALGLVLGAIYDLIRAVRMLIRARKLHVIISDIIFFAVCGVATSLFALPFNKGDVRAFIIFGEAAGFLIYRLTLGSIMGKFYSHIAVILRTIIQKIYKIIEKIFDLLLKVTSVLVYNIHEVIDKLIKRSTEIHKKHRAERRKRKLADSRIDKGRIYEQKKRTNKKARDKRTDRRQRG